MSRSNDIKEFHHRYHVMWPKDINDTYNCFYCGDVRQCKDHFPPINYAFMYDSSQPHLLVNSCNECNSMLSSSIQNNLMDRKAYIQNKLRHRYAKQINCLWTEAELDKWERENGKSRLLTSVKAFSDGKNDIIDRVNYPGYEYDIDGIKGDWYEECLKITILGIIYQNYEIGISEVCKENEISLQGAKLRISRGEPIEDVVNNMTDIRTFNIEIRRIAKDQGIKIGSLRTKFNKERKSVNFMNDIEALYYLERNIK